MIAISSARVAYWNGVANSICITGKYAPADADLEQYVDVTADYAGDWARAVFKAIFNPPVSI